MKLQLIAVVLCVLGLSAWAYFEVKSRGFDEAEAKNLPYHLGLYVHSYEVLSEAGDTSNQQLNDLKHDIIMTVNGIRNRYQTKPKLLELVTNDGEKELLIEWIDKANLYLEQEGY